MRNRNKMSNKLIKPKKSLCALGSFTDPEVRPIVPQAEIIETILT